ncbi:MAG TPA: PQQ-binding-like beta-propeller repeat protein [Gemmatimonadales bacterium]|nr:PQQ-binding-like beta-propeller repeat protein [Gemmatimonadales bacterium]
MGRRPRGWSLALALGCVNAACGGYRPDPAPRSAPKITPTPVPGTPLTAIWAAHGPHQITEPLVQVDSSLYLAGGGRQVTKMDVRGGAVIWSLRVGGPVAGGVVYRDGKVYAATDAPEGKVHAWTVVAGNDAWTRSTGPVSAPLALVDSLVIVRTRGGETDGLDARTGDLKWRSHTSAGPAPALAGAPTETIVPAMDTVYRLDTGSGHIRQRVPSPGPLIFPLIYRDSVALGVTADGVFFQIRLADLHIDWRLATNSVPAGPPLMIGDTMVVVSRLGHFYQIRPGDPGPVRVFGDSAAPVTIGPMLLDDQLLVGAADGVVSARDRQGKEVWRVQVKRPIEVAPMLTSAGLLVVGGDGDVHLFRR